MKDQKKDKKVILDTCLFCISIFLLFADQNLLAPNLSKVAEEFGFNSIEKDQKLGGDIAMGFFLVGGITSLLVGYLTDTGNRCHLFGAVVIFGEASCLATYFVSNYWQLLICRILTGISIGGATPVLFSLLGDLYADSSRVYVSTIVGIASNGGAAAGQLLAGFIGPAFGWRLPFLVISAPAIFCAMLIFSFADEPNRGEQEKEVRAHRQLQHTGNLSTAIASNEISFTSSTTVTNSGYSEKIEWRKLVSLVGTPSVVLILLQGIPGCLPWGMIIVFLNDFFSNEGKMSVEAATATLAAFSVGGFVGQLCGGWLGQRLYNRDPRLQCLLMGLSTLLGVGPMLLLLSGGPSHGLNWSPWAVAVASGALATATGPNVRAVLQNVCLPEIRGTAFALFTLTDDIGKGLGPALVVMFIRVCDGDRRTAFQAIVLSWLLCGGILLLLVATVRTDEARVQSRLREALSNSNAAATLNDNLLTITASSGSVPVLVSGEGAVLAEDPTAIADVECHHRIKKSK